MDAQQVIDELNAQQGIHQLSIIKISEPFLLLSDVAKEADLKRSSDASSTAEGDAPTPASLEADLTHYKELFTKLRFSYLEQVTKEKFLRSLIEQPLPTIPLSAITTLETQLATTKSALQAQKAAVATLVTDLENHSRVLARRYHSIQTQTEALQALPGEVEGLREAITALKEADQDAAWNKEAAGDAPEMRLPLSQTLALIAEREAQLAGLERQSAGLEAGIENRRRELGRVEAELEPLEAQKATLTTAAKEARRRREAGVSGVEDELEVQGRWYRGVNALMRNVLEVEG